MERIIVYKKPESPVSEAYRAMCTNLMVTLGEKKIVEMVGVADNSNISPIIANLSVAMAQAGKEVLVIDCNLRSPKQHELFGVSNIGLADCVTSGEYFKTFVQATAQANLFLLPAGAVVNPVEILLSQTILNILNEARETYDIVLLDVSPAGGVSDAITLGIKADGVVLVLNNKEDKVVQAQKVKELFKQANVPVLGCVLNKV